MFQAPKLKPDAPDAARGFSAMTEKVGAPVPAAWPTGLSHLTQAYEACWRCDVDQTCAD